MEYNLFRILYMKQKFQNTMDICWILTETIFKTAQKSLYYKFINFIPTHTNLLGLFTFHGYSFTKYYTVEEIYQMYILPLFFKSDNNGQICKQ